MLKITDVKLSKNTVATGEKFTISVQIQETVDYPYDYPYDYPISYTGTARKSGERHIDADIYHCASNLIGIYCLALAGAKKETGAGRKRA